MAFDAFMKLDGIKGESKDDKHKNEIDVLSFSWGAAQLGTHGFGGGGGAGKVDVHDMTFTKKMDSSSPDIMLACCNGKHLKDATLLLRKAGENPVDYLKVKMEDVLISGYNTGGHGGDEVITENVTLNFAKFDYEYVEQDAKGKGMAPKKIGWDIEKNIKK
jgi:type VI secretion system secreted protein Hcp